MGIKLAHRCEGDSGQDDATVAAVISIHSAASARMDCLAQKLRGRRRPIASRPPRAGGVVTRFPGAAA